MKVSWAKWPYMVGGLAAIGALAVGATVIKESHDFARVATRYEGLGIGMKREEVLYLKGIPPVVLAPEENPTLPAPPSGFSLMNYSTDAESKWPKLPANKTFRDAPYWSYVAFEQPAQAPTVQFDASGRVIQIECGEFGAQGGVVCDPLFGVMYGNPEARIVEFLGKPSTSELDGEVKIIKYDDIGAEFLLAKGAVYMLRLKAVHGGSKGEQHYWKTFFR